MSTKMSMLIELTTAVSQANAVRHRVGGWSETVYRTGAFTDGQRNDFLELCRRRAALLPIGAVIIGQRYQPVDPPGASSTGSATFPGSAVAQADVPQMALLCKAPGVGVRNQRKLEIRGIPDARVVEGEYSPSQAFETALTRYFQQLGLFYFRGRDLAQTEYPVFQILETGVVTTTAPNTFVVGNMVRLLDAVNVDKDNVSGLYRVSAVADTTHFTIDSWTGGKVTANCKVRLDGTTYCQIDGVNITGRKAVVRKVGRPFDQYRGRASNRS